MSSVILSGVHKSYPGSDTAAVIDLDLEIPESEFLCLLGPSGCGKTTTLRMIAGLEHLSAGEIRIGNDIVDSAPVGRFVKPEHRGLGLVFQSYALWPHLTVFQNVEFGLRLRKTPQAQREQLCSEVMETLSIGKYRDRYPSQLSGGQQQRVALARMLVMNPRVILLDEPLSNLDAKLRLEMRAELKRIHREFGSTVIFVTHDQWEAMTLATTIAVMSEGVLQQIGSPTDIYDRPANRFVAEFVGSLPINMIEVTTEHPIPIALRFLRYLSTTLPAIGRPGSVGIRPEAVHVCAHRRDVPRGAFSSEARIIDVLPTGGSWIIEVDVALRRIFALVDDLPSVKAGDDALIWVHSSQLHIFDEDGSRVYAADGVIAEAQDPGADRRSSARSLYGKPHTNGPAN
ncbi:ABC transporter ATP-binding protein [Mycolicibacterium sp.]|uniref:ABC transporter ATP-binding protein n=1 Tax=Mycolicibacterium sp. TaxID=2320850 RepID=UPI003D0E8DA1